MSMKQTTVLQFWMLSQGCQIYSYTQLTFLIFECKNIYLFKIFIHITKEDIMALDNSLLQQ